MKYTHKPLSVDAFQFLGFGEDGNYPALVKFVAERASLTRSGNRLRLATPGTTVYLSPGDWLLDTSEGFEVLSDSIFKARYTRSK